MAKGIADLKTLIKLAREEGLKSLSFEGIAFEFSNNPHTQPSSGDSLASLLSEAEAEMPTEDEMLFRSSPYYDQLISQRAKAKDAPNGN